MRKALRSIKNVAYAYNEIELQVRAATNNDRFMVSNNQLAGIARATNDYQEYPSLFAMLWKRLTDLEHVMHVTKALAVVEYLLRHGAERFINDAKRRARDIAALQKYKHYDDQNQDDAKEARARAKGVYALLMDDQLLAQERGKSARLASEGRLGGSGAAGHREHGGYDHDAEDEESPVPPPRRAAPAPASTPPRSGAVRRRSIDEDPFENPVIPASVAPAAKPRAKPQKPVEAEVEEPEDDEEAEAAAAKKAKKEKKKAKKEAEARRAAEEASAAAVAARKQAAARPPAGSSPAAELDLMAFGDSPAAFGGDVDIMTGFSSNAQSSGRGDQDLADIFASQSLADAQPLFFQDDGDAGHHNGGHHNAGHNSGFQSPEGQSYRENPTPSPTGALVNLNDLLAPKTSNNRSSVDTGVSMSMMRSIQPLGSPAAQAQQPQQQVKRSNVHSSVPLNQPYALNGFMQHPSGMMGGPQMGGPQYPQQQGMHPGMQMGYPQQQQGMHPGMQMQGGMHPGMQMHMQGSAPMMALMPPGMNGGGHGGPSGPGMGSYGSMPFASPSGSTHTAMRQAPKTANGVPIFDVVAASSSVRAVEPTNYLDNGHHGGHGHHGPRDDQYQSFYGKPNGAQQQRY